MNNIRPGRLVIIYDENYPEILPGVKKAPPGTTPVIIPQKRKAPLTERLTGRHNMGHQRIGIAKFVVVPGVDRAEVAIHHFGEREVDEGRVGLAYDIRGNKLIVSHRQYFPPAWFGGGGAEKSVHLLDGRSSRGEKNDS